MAKKSKATSLPATLDIINIEQLQTDLLSFIEKKSSDYTLDASMVERITTPSIQLLIACDNSLKKSDKSLAIKSPSEAMQSAFSQLGLSAQLDAWSNA